MPLPVSATETRTLCPLPVVMVSVPPAGIASFALRNRFRKTCCSLPVLPKIGGRCGCNSGTTLMRAVLNWCSSSVSVSWMTRFRSTLLNSELDVREKFSRLLTISEARKVCFVIFSSSSAFFGSPFTCFESICAYDEITASGVLTSCATPAASSPMDDSFSACESCDSSSMRSVMSSTMIRRPMTVKSLLTSGAMAMLVTRVSPAVVLMRNL